MMANDKLDGGTGVDSMAGGAGNDTYVVDDVGDKGDGERPVDRHARQGTEFHHLHPPAPISKSSACSAARRSTAPGTA